MEYICKPSKVSIYINTLKKTAKQIKAETGCDAIINGGLFNMSTLKATGNLKADGVEISREWGAAQGYEWSGNELPRFGWSEMNADNFIGCIALVENGTPIAKLNYPKEMGGKRPRTAMGTFADGRIWLYASQAINTPEELRDIAAATGVKDAVMLDGGGSTQGIFGDDAVTSTRVVHDFICIWKEKEMVKIGHASVDENGKAAGGAAGDSTKKEICTRSWYNGNWNVVLRPKSATLAEKSAKACEAACANDKIGYDQYQRNTLYTEAKALNFDIAKIVKACETDCSALMHVCAIAGGANLTYGSNGLVTWNMVDAFVKTGQYEKLTDSKYLTADTYLKRGDILVRESGHTAMVLENGGQATTTTTQANTISVNLPLLVKGSKGKYVYMLQALLKAEGFSCGDIDGDFGNKTYIAVCNYQRAKRLGVDGKAGTEVWTSLLK